MIVSDRKNRLSSLGVGVSKATAYRYLVAMDERGMLEYDGSSRTIVTKLEPETEEENIVEYVSLPVSLFGHGDFYILKADGDSMTDAGIDNGDMVVIRKQSSANVGDIVVALDEHQLNTLKLYAGVDEETGEVILRYCNKERYPDKEIRVRELVVQGVAKHVIKALG